MKCPKCSYVSFDYNELCPKCHRDVRQVREQMNLITFKPNPPSVLDILAAENERGGSSASRRASGSGRAGRQEAFRREASEEIAFRGDGPSGPGAESFDLHVQPEGERASQRPPSSGGGTPVAGTEDMHVVGEETFRASVSGEATEDFSIHTEELTLDETQLGPEEDITPVSPEEFSFDAEPMPSEAAGVEETASLDSLEEDIASIDLEELAADQPDLDVEELMPSESRKEEAETPEASLSQEEVEEDLFSELEELESEEEAVDLDSDEPSEGTEDIESELESLDLDLDFDKEEETKS